MLALVLALLAGQTHAKWEASAVVGVRTRTPTAQDLGKTISGDVELSPRGAAILTNGRWMLVGFYGPTLRSPEPWVLGQKVRSPVEHSHVAGVELSWTKEALARIYVGEYFRYGLFDLLSQDAQSQNQPAPAQGAPPPPPPVNAVSKEVVTELTSDSSAGFDLYFTPRLTLATSGGFLYSGGADVKSRESLPLYSAPRVASKLNYVASPRDTVSVGAGFQYIRFYQVPATATTPAKEGARTFLLELSGGYQHLFAERTSVDLAVGMTGMFGQIPDASNALRTVSGVAPLLGAGLNHRVAWRSQQLDLRADAKLGPYVDRQTGGVYTRAEGGAGATWSNTDHVSASLSAGVSRSLPTNDVPLSTVSGEASAAYQGDPWWKLELSGRFASIHRPPGPESIPMPPPYPGDTVARPADPWSHQFLVGLSFTAMIGSDQPRTFRE